MGIRKISMNKWRLDYAFRTAEGKQHRIQKTIECSFPEAKKKYEELKIHLHEKIVKDEKPSVKPLTMLDLKNRYIEYCLERSGNISGIVHYLRYPVEYFGEDTYVKDLTQAQIEDYRRWLKSEKIDRKTATINRAVAYFRSMINRAVDYEWGGLTQSPFRKYNMVYEERKAKNPISKDEFKLLIQNANPELKDIIYFLYYTGCRTGEALGLKWEQIDFELRTITLRTKDSKRKGRTIVKPINDQLLILLHARQKSNRFRKSDFLFPNSKDTSVPLNSIKKVFKNACKRAGLVGITPHQIRHSYVSHLLMSGVDIETVSKLVGHSSIKITSDYYSHLSQDHLRAASNIVGKILPYNKVS